MLVLKDVLTDIAKAIVDHPEAVSVEEADDGTGSVTLTLSVSPDDMGMVIGRHGKIAKAIRTVMKAAGNSIKTKVTVDIK